MPVTPGPGDSSHFSGHDAVDMMHDPTEGFNPQEASLSDNVSDSANTVVSIANENLRVNRIRHLTYS
jgi:hypothetical protein